jgi:ligand-binding sensor domain-containing protein/signal transduction histidine kinase
MVLDIDPGKLGPAICAGVLLLMLVLSLCHTNHAFAQQTETHAIVATVLPGVTTAQITPKTDVQFRKLALSQGLSQTRVGQIIQDDDGYIWLGSQHGVNRYDGYNFRVFKHDRDDPGSLSGVYIYSLFKDRAGTVWIGSDQLLDAFDRKTGTFRHYVLDVSTPTVLQISEDRDGFLWLSTSQGLYRLEPKSGQVQKFGHVEGDPDSLSTDDVKSTGEDRDGTFWVATGNGLEAFDPKSGKVSLRIPLHVEAREFGFYEDSHGLFWMFYGTGNGLVLYDKVTKTAKQISFSTADDNLSGIYNIIEARNGDLWFATMGAGLLKFNRSNFSFDQYVNDPTDPQSLAENRVIQVFEDRQGNIWTGMHASPPNIFTRAELPFHKLWPFPGHVNKMGETFVNAVFEDKVGDVWLAAGGALNRIDRNGVLKVFDLAGQNKAVEILSIVQDKDGLLWIGTIGRGLYSLDPETEDIGSYRYDKSRPNWITSDVVTRIYADPTGVLWLSTWNGLNRFDPKTQKFNAYRADGSSNRAFFSLIPDDSGNLWIASLVGLVKFEISSGTFTEFKHNPDDASSLSNNTVNNVFRDRSGTFWLATHNGLNRFHPETGKFEAYFERDGLAGSAISCIQEDAAGQLWLSTNHGVSRMNPTTNEFKNYTSADGLPGDDMGGWHACSAGKGGKLYFAGFPGAAATNPAYLERNSTEISLAFTDIKIGDRSAFYPLKGKADAYSLAHDQNMAVTFSALDFSNPDGMKYRYELAGVDNDWHILPNGSRSINFAALPSGAFTLNVQTATERGDWLAKGASLSINVASPWWRTWWFYSLALLLVALVASALYRIRMLQLASIYNMRLEERVGERTRVARDLHDTLLQSFQGVTYRLEAVKNLLPEHPDEAAQLLELVLLKSDDALVEGRETIQSLRDTTKVTGNLISAVKADADELVVAQVAGRTADFGLTVEGVVQKFPTHVRNELRQIAREALRNAFTHSQATKIECIFRFERGIMHMTVKDNGTGIGGDKKLARSGRYGLSGIEERSDQIEASLNIESVEGLGTKVELSISTDMARLHAIAKRSTNDEQDWF